jgi:hypothetical protein
VWHELGLEDALHDAILEAEAQGSWFQLLTARHLVHVWLQAYLSGCKIRACGHLVQLQAVYQTANLACCHSAAELGAEQALLDARSEDQPEEFGN